MPLVQARGLAKAFGGKPAVVDLSFDVVPGAVTGFLGPNGAGKSTTMRLMLGLDNGAGVTTFDGTRYRDLREPLRHVGTVLDAKPFHPTRSARDHLRMIAVSNKIPTTRVDQVLDLVGLAQVARAKPKTYSLGMGQRLGLAAALLGDPGTLILDEPANGLDPQGVHWLRSMLRTLAAQGRSVFVSSHLLAEMALMADHLVVLGRGRLIGAGPLQGFIAASSHSAVVARVDRPAALAEAARAAGGEARAEADGSLAITGLALERVSDLVFDLRLRVLELTRRQPTLEEAFLEATGASEEFRASMGLAAGPPVGPPPAVAPPPGPPPVDGPPTGGPR